MKYWVFYVRSENIYRVSFDEQAVAEKFAKTVRGTIFNGNFVKEFKG